MTPEGIQGTSSSTAQILTAVFTGVGLLITAITAAYVSVVMARTKTLAANASAMNLDTNTKVTDAVGVAAEVAKEGQATLKEIKTVMDGPLAAALAALVVAYEEKSDRTGTPEDEKATQTAKDNAAYHARMEFGKGEQA